MRIVKERLREMLPDISVFLDVDNLGGGKDFPHIDVSNVVVCYCTRRWFTNPPCIREAVRAVLREKPLIALLEPSIAKGGHTEAECRRILRGEVWYGNEGETYQSKLDDMREQVAQWAVAWGDPTLKLPTPEEIEAALFRQKPLTWSRLTDPQEVSVRIIAQSLVEHVELAKRSYDDPYQQTTYMQDELAHKVKLNPTVLPSVREDSRHHLFCSPRNAGAEAVVRELHALFPLLKWTTDVDELDACEHIVILLTKQTWTSSAESAAFAHEVCDAMRLGVHCWLVHEVPGVRMGDTRHACSFEELIDATKEHYPYLMNPPARLYNEIAMNLGEDEWRECGLLKMGQQLGKLRKPRSHWVREPAEPAEVVAALGSRRRRSTVASSRLSKMQSAASGFLQPLQQREWRMLRLLPWRSEPLSKAIFRDYQSDNMAVDSDVVSMATGSEAPGNDGIAGGQARRASLNAGRRSITERV